MLMTMSSKRHLRLVASNPDACRSSSKYARRMCCVPDSDGAIVKTLRDYADRLIDQIEFDFGDKTDSIARSNEEVLQAIHCLSPSRALELMKELNLISFLTASREISLAAKSKLAEADYII